MWGAEKSHSYKTNMEERFMEDIMKYVIHLEGKIAILEERCNAIEDKIALQEINPSERL